jgi:predicted NUDIX family NTP pyrophosphohydrolase
MFRRCGAGVEVLLVHPGGPYWKDKDLGAWSIPKGQYDDTEDPLAAAQREFAEETGWTASPPFIELGSLKQPSGKLVTVWAFKGDGDPATVKSNLFEIEWPPRSGRTASFPEVDRAEWFDPDEARRRILKGQVAFIDAFERIVAAPSPRHVSPP